MDSMDRQYFTHKFVDHPRPRFHLTLVSPLIYTCIILALTGCEKIPFFTG